MNGLNMGRQRLLRIEAEQKVMKMCLSIGQMVAEAQGGTLEDEGATGLESTSIILSTGRLESLQPFNLSVCLSVCPSQL
jgi:hypothetical protein